MMAQGSDVSQAQSKRDLDQLSHNLFNINLQIQQLRQGVGNNQQQIAILDAASIQIQKEVELELKKAQGKRRC